MNDAFTPDLNKPDKGFGDNSMTTRNLEAGGIQSETSCQGNLFRNIRLRQDFMGK